MTDKLPLKIAQVTALLEIINDFRATGKLDDQINSKIAKWQGWRRVTPDDAIRDGRRGWMARRGYWIDPDTTNCQICMTAPKYMEDFNLLLGLFVTLPAQVPTDRVALLELVLQQNLEAYRVLEAGS